MSSRRWGGTFAPRCLSARARPGRTRERDRMGTGRGGVRQQIIPRLALLNDEDDGVTCRMCLQPFWYKSELFEHLKTLHSISDPERYEKEEREKKNVCVFSCI